jgi:hypothetical protein
LAVFSVLMMVGEAQAQLISFPPYPWLVGEAEALFCRTQAEVEYCAREARGLGIISITIQATALRPPDGDISAAPDPFGVVLQPSSIFNITNDPDSGISKTKTTLFTAKIASLRLGGIVPWVNVFEKEHYDNDVFDFAVPFTGEMRGYLEALGDAITIGSPGPVVVGWEECQAPQEFVVEWLRFWKVNYGEMVRTSLHNYPNQDDTLFGGLMGNPDLDIIALQISQPSIAHNYVTEWAGKAAAGGGGAVVIALEVGPYNTGIAPDKVRDSRMVRWWGEEVRDAGAKGNGIYVGYQWPWRDNNLKSFVLSGHSGWCGEMLEVWGRGLKLGVLEGWVLGYSSSPPAWGDLNGDGVVDVADLVKLSVSD